MTLSEISRVLYCVNTVQSTNRKTRKDQNYKDLIKVLEDLYNKEFSKFYIRSVKYYYEDNECVIMHHKKSHCHIVMVHQNDSFNYLNTSKSSQCVMYSDLQTKDQYKAANNE